MLSVALKSKKERKKADWKLCVCVCVCVCVFYQEDSLLSNNSLWVQCGIFTELFHCQKAFCFPFFFWDDQFSVISEICKPDFHCSQCQVGERGLSVISSVCRLSLNHLICSVISYLILVIQASISKNIIDWWLKQQIIFSHSSGGWGVQGQGPGKSDVWWGLALLLFHSCFLTVCSHGGEWERASEQLPSLSLLLEALIPFVRVSHSKPITSHRPHL